MDLIHQSVTQIAAAVNADHGLIAQITKQAEREIIAAEPLNAVVHWRRDQLDAAAKVLGKKLANARTLPLAGVPIVVKDNIITSGLPTTCGSKILGLFETAYHATAVKRLVEAGALIVAKTNMDEFGMGNSTTHSRFGATKNPRDPRYVAGGSSGGTAAAVAAKVAPVGLGSDTGGSVRQPAGFCGVYGLKPNYGRVSRSGLVAYGSSLDQIGPIARSLADCAVVLDAMCGQDTLDQTTLSAAPTKCFAAVNKPTNKPRVAILREAVPDDPETRELYEACLDQARRQGFELFEISLPELKYVVAVYYTIAMAEASANLSRFDGIRYGARGSEGSSVVPDSREQGFGIEVKRRIIAGAYFLSAGYYSRFYGKATALRKVLRAGVARVLTNADAIVLPTSPVPPWAIGEKTDDPLTSYLADIYTVVPNLTGFPALSVPSGSYRSGLPFGLQFWGKECGEELLFSVAAAYERN